MGRGLYTLPARIELSPLKSREVTLAVTLNALPCPQRRASGLEVLRVPASYGSVAAYLSTSSRLD